MYVNIRTQDGFFVFAAIQLLASMMLTGVSLLTTMVVLNLYNQSADKRLPPGMRTVFLNGLGRVFLKQKTNQVSSTLQVSCKSTEPKIWQMCQTESSLEKQQYLNYMFSNGFVA